MNNRLITIFLSALALTMSSCKDIIEPSLNGKTVSLAAPGDQSKSTSYTINFWWNEVEDALDYRLQAVTGTFNNPDRLVLDTVIKSNKFTHSFAPGEYQWRIQAQNGSSKTAFSAPKSFTILLGTIKGQLVQLRAPTNNLSTNQSPLILEWSDLYGATKYHIEVDTNNFADEKVLVLDQAIPGLQISFNSSKDKLYQWRVRAENDTAKAEWSLVNNFTLDRTPPAAVSLTSPADGQQGRLPINLQWGSVTSATRYKLYVFKNDISTPYTGFPMTINGTSYNFNTGAIGDKFYWKIAAVDAAGNEGTASALRSFVLN